MFKVGQNMAIPLHCQALPPGPLPGTRFTNKTATSPCQLAPRPVINTICHKSQCKPAQTNVIGKLVRRAHRSPNFVINLRKAGKMPGPTDRLSSIVQMYYSQGLCIL